MTGDRNAALARLRQEMEGPPFHQLLQPDAIDADPDSGTVVIRLTFRDHLARAKGDPAFHGGVIAALIDLAGHAAVAVKIGRMAPTIDLRIDYLRPAEGWPNRRAGGRRYSRRARQDSRARPGNIQYGIRTRQNFLPDDQRRASAPACFVSSQAYVLPGFSPRA